MNTQKNFEIMYPNVTNICIFCYSKICWFLVKKWICQWNWRGVSFDIFFFFFFFSTDTDHSQDTRGREGTTSTHSRTLRHLFPTLHARWLSRIFNHNVYFHQTATWWDLPAYGIVIRLIDWWCSVCSFTWWIDSRFLLQRFGQGKLLDLNCHRLSPLYYKRTD